MTKRRNKEEAILWFKLFKIIIEKESHTALSVNDLVNSVNNQLDKFITTCKNNNDDNATT